MVLIPNQDAKLIRCCQQRFGGRIVSRSPGIGAEVLQLSQAVHLPVDGLGSTEISGTSLQSNGIHGD